MSISPPKTDRKVRIDDYVAYHRDGYICLRQLISPATIEELKQLSDDILYGREPLPGLDPVPDPPPAKETLYQRFTRIHMLHRGSERAERGLLLPPVLTVLEALIGPDVLALQSMMFLNPPGRGGQGWHQDSYYIPTFPDTLIGVWIAVDDADEENGCLWVAPGTNHEPVYPPKHLSRQVHNAQSFQDLQPIENASHLNDAVNTLSPVSVKHAKPVSMPMKSGDVLFFNGHILHRSHPNRTADRLRRAYVCHYCNARSWVPWNHGAPYPEEGGNGLHILASGWSHLPFASPAFGTPVRVCKPEPGAQADRMMGGEDGVMEPESGIAVMGDLHMG